MVLKHLKHFIKNCLFKCLIITNIVISSMNVGVVALIEPNAGFSYITFDKSDVCSNIFNDNPCGYMKNILKVFLDTSEQEKSTFMDQIKRLEEEVNLLKKQPAKQTPEIPIFHNFSKRSIVNQHNPNQDTSLGILHVLRNINQVISKYIQNITRFSKLNDHLLFENLGNVSISICFYWSIIAIYNVPLKPKEYYQRRPEMK